MIAVDTSALFAILLREPDGWRLSERIDAEERVLIGVPTAFELAMVAFGRGGSGLAVDAAEMLREAPIELVPFTVTHLAHAQDAFGRFGKGTGHPARLNFGDCMSYAVAREAGCALLYKGGDFALTDIAAAL